MLLHRVGLSFVGEGSYLHVEKFVACAWTDSRIEAALPQRACQDFGIFLPADCGDLHHDGVARDDGGVAGGLGERRHGAGMGLGGQRGAVGVGNSVE